MEKSTRSPHHIYECWREGWGEGVFLVKRAAKSFFLIFYFYMEIVMFMIITLFWIVSFLLSFFVVLLSIHIRSAHCPIHLTLWGFNSIEIQSSRVWRVVDSLLSSCCVGCLKKHIWRCFLEHMMFVPMVGVFETIFDLFNN